MVLTTVLLFGFVINSLWYLSMLMLALSTVCRHRRPHGYRLSADADSRVACVELHRRARRARRIVIVSRRWMVEL